MPSRLALRDRTGRSKEAFYKCSGTRRQVPVHVCRGGRELLSQFNFLVADGTGECRRGHIVERCRTDADLHKDKSVVFGRGRSWGERAEKIAYWKAGARSALWERLVPTSHSSEFRGNGAP
jgi:hypothetical protein